MRAIAITGSQVMKILYAMEPYSVNHGEVSEAIAQAANHDPLFPSREDGCFRTAAILLAIAFLASGFQPNIVGNNGKSFGLYQIRPPATNAHGQTVMTNMLTNPRDASLIAVDLVRQSMMQGAGKSWEERLSWFASLNDTSSPSAASVMKKSLSQMLLADKIVRDHFPEYVKLPKPDVEAAQGKERLLSP